MYKPSPLLKISLICWPVCFPPEHMLEADVVLFTYRRMRQTAVRRLCAFRPRSTFWWRATLRDLLLHHTVNAFTIQNSMAAGQLVGVVSIAHFTCSHARPFPTTFKTKWNRSAVCPPPHARCFIDGCAMPAAPCTVMFPDIWYLCTCYPLPRREWVSILITARLILLLHSEALKKY